MQKVRQGILARNYKTDNGRNKTTIDQNQQILDQKKWQKYNNLQNVAEHRRIVIDGTQNEKTQLQKETKQNIDIQVQAKQRILKDLNRYNSQQDQIQLRQFQDYAQQLDQKQETRRQYQVKIMEENKQLAKMNIDRLRNEKFNEQNTEVNAYNSRAQKNSMNYL